MSRYEWPAPPRQRRGRATQRRAYNQGNAAGADPDALQAARGARAAADAAAAPPAAPRLPPAARARARAAMRAAPAGGANLWLPMGPVGTLRGTGDSDPRVAGRVRDLAVSADGQRVYAASALGGLWYSDTAGARWEPVGAYATTPVGNLAASSTTLACGALHVRFDPGDDVSQDQVWLGTGEPDPRVQPRDFGVVGNYGGVGVLHAQGPVATARNPATATNDPWTREAQPNGGYPGLRGAGIFSLAVDPAGPGRMVAATTRGLHLRDPAAVGGGDPWTLVTVAQWEAALGAGGSAQAVVTDAVWVTTGAGDRLWITVAGANVDQRLKGLWRSGNGPAGPWTRVDLPGAATVAGRTGLLRLALAAAPSDGTVVYVLGNAPRLWRVDGDATIRRVNGLPGQLFSGTPGQSEYDMAIVVDPGNPQRVILGGASVTSAIDTSMPAAALYRITLRTPAPAPTGTWSTTYSGGNQWDASWVGAEVHPDVHRVRWVSPAPAPSAGHVFVCCDGGIYRSTDDASLGSFASRASGLAVTEPGFLACHPTSDGIVVAGVQDNGVQMRIGDTVWRRALLNGDGGGVAFDPGRPDRFIGQSTQASWVDQDGTTNNPTWRSGANAPQVTEENATRFYSNAAVLRRADGTTQIAVGTSRVWYSEQWLHSFLDTPAGVFRIQAVTLPSRTDPRSGDAADTVTDVLPSGPAPPGTIDTWASGIRVLRWAGEDRLYALMRGAVHRLDRNTGTGRWTRTQVYRRPTGGPPPPVAVGPNLPQQGALNDLAVHDPTTGPHGSFYLATANPVQPVWWFDGTNTWHPCQLGDPPPGAGVTATAYAVLVDPAHPDLVYVGTSVGVWLGTLTTPGGVPTWNWAALTNGLPEAAVQDLVLASYPRPDGGGDVRLLRAALQSRGVWELDLDTAVTPLTYLRAHPYDTRRLLPTVMADPMFRAGGTDAEWHLDWGDVRARDFRTGAGVAAPHPDGTPVGEFLWHASPDIRVRPAPGSAALAVPASLPWTSRPADRFALWALQTALRTIDPRVVPDGRWTAMFRRRLRQIRSARGLSNQTRVDATLWNHADVQAGFWADPWAEGGPTEADLVERVVAMPTPRPGGPSAATISPASVGVPAGPLKVDICVHHRGPSPADAATSSVLLLQLPLPADPAAWPLLPGIVLTAVAAAIEAAMQAAPPVGGPLPGAALPAGYAVADTALAIRRPTGTLDTVQPAIVSFDLDLTGTPTGTRLLLLALVHAEAGTPTLVGADLRTLVRTSPQVAARSIEVV